MTARQKFKSLSLAKQVLAGIAAVLGSLAVIGSAIGYSYSKVNELHFDAEAESAALLNVEARILIVAQHQKDKVTSAEARKNDRLDRLDREIRKTDEEILFDKNLTADQKQYKRDLRSDLVKKKECIRKGEC